jgi:preprotein translocase subunit YajC
MWINPAYAQAAGGAGSSDFLVQMAPLVLIFVVFYLLLIRPQQKKMKEHRELLSGVKRGDRVVTGGGIIGTVTKVIGDAEAQVEIADGVRIRILKSTITSILDRGQSVKADAKDATEEQPMIKTVAPASGQSRPGLLGSLFGKK